MQGTGGSTSTWANFAQLRQAGGDRPRGAGRRGRRPPRGRRRRLPAPSWAGSTMRRAAKASASASWPKRRPPCRCRKDAPLKDKKDFKLIGKPVRRVDSPAKVKGQAKFSFDARLPNMAIAQVARSPYFGGKLKSFDAAARPRHARRAVDRRGAGRGGGGGRRLLAGPPGARRAQGRVGSGRRRRARFRQAARGIPARSPPRPGVVGAQEGDPEAALAAGAKGSRRATRCLSSPTRRWSRFPAWSISRRTAAPRSTPARSSWGPDTQVAAAVLGIPVEKIVFHNHLLGGAFGRRANAKADFLVLALHVAIAAKALRRPIKTVWSREDDIRGGFYRPMWQNHFEGALDERGKIVAWRHRLVGQSILAGTPFEPMLVKNGIDETSVEGASTLPYDIPNLGVELHTVKSAIPTLWWRSVGHSNTGYATEHFFDEMARLAGRDPYQMRREHAGRRTRATCGCSTWWPRRPAGRSRRSPASAAASRCTKASRASSPTWPRSRSVPKASRGSTGVVCAIDCGPVVNPDIVRAQLEGAVCFALSAILYGEIQIKDGQVVNSNFHDYPLLRIHEAPKIEAHLADSNDEMGGVGEPGLPPVAAAVANAILDLTGKPVRKLPIFSA